jgi:hypothetical protein
MNTKNIIKKCLKHNCDKIYIERIVKNKKRREFICKLCNKEKNKQKYEKNRNLILLKAKKYIEKNKDKINESRKGKYKKTTEIYRKNNAKAISKKRNANKKRRRKNDITYRIRENVSSVIRLMFKGINKKKSYLKHIDWTPELLKKHLELQFEPWMNWANYGVFTKAQWDDNNQSTWKWHIDHIIPQSDLPYTSMEDENFKKCWALENLRPYSAKQNVIDGANRERHK